MREEKRYMIEKATLKDIDNIMEIIKETVKEMKTYNNTQWDETYPQAIDFIRDIELEDLYVEKQKDVLTGFICINDVEASEYKELNWSSNEKCMVIHRMAVNPRCRNQGVGSRLMNFAQNLAIKEGVKYLKTDTYSRNIKMNSLFERFEYNYIGDVNFREKEFPFYCYDKVLN
ncbi:MAG: GNAT family N-acetyltransferase [Peptostreptococcaceae bacterium]